MLSPIEILHNIWVHGRSESSITPDAISGRIVIERTRYGGSYEGGNWAASVGELPDEAHGDDPEAYKFWRVEHSNEVGVGATPNDALDDLVAKVNREVENDGDGWSTPEDCDCWICVEARGWAKWTSAGATTV